MPDKKKYRIQEFIDNLEKKWTFKRIATLLKEEHGIAQATFSRDKAIDMYDAYSIPCDRLEIYAKLFNVKMEEMTNYFIDVIPITDINPEDVITEQKLIKGK